MSYRLSKKVLLLRLSQPFFDLYSVWLSDLVDFCISGDKASYLSNVVSSLPNISLVPDTFLHVATTTSPLGYKDTQGYS